MIDTFHNDFKKAIKSFGISYDELGNFSKDNGIYDRSSIWRILNGKRVDINPIFYLKVINHMQQKMLTNQKILENIAKNFYDIFNENIGNTNESNNT